MEPKTWLIVGASRGIGFEFVQQILGRGDRVIATVRNSGSALEAIVQDVPCGATILTCDVSRQDSIDV